MGPTNACHCHTHHHNYAPHHHAPCGSGSLTSTVTVDGTCRSFRCVAHRGRGMNTWTPYCWILATTTSCRDCAHMKAVLSTPICFVLACLSNINSTRSCKLGELLYGAPTVCSAHTESAWQSCRQPRPCEPCELISKHLYRGKSLDGRGLFHSPCCATCGISPAPNPHTHTVPAGAAPPTICWTHRLHLNCTPGADAPCAVLPTVHALSALDLAHNVQLMGTISKLHAHASRTGAQ